MAASRQVSSSERPGPAGLSGVGVAAVGDSAERKARSATRAARSRRASRRPPAAEQDAGKGAAQTAPQVVNVKARGVGRALDASLAGPAHPRSSCARSEPARLLMGTGLLT